MAQGSPPQQRGPPNSRGRHTVVGSRGSMVRGGGSRGSLVGSRGRATVRAKVSARGCGVWPVGGGCGDGRGAADVGVGTNGGTGRGDQQWAAIWAWGPAVGGGRGVGWTWGWRCTWTWARRVTHGCPCVPSIPPLVPHPSCFTTLSRSHTNTGALQARGHGRRRTMVPVHHARP